MDPRMRRAICLITTDLSHTITIRDIAQSVNVSFSHFTHLFLRETGSSPGKLLRASRMLAAQRMLETSNPSIKEVVSQAGFGDESHFLRDFKEIHGVTPSEYRAKYNPRISDTKVKKQKSPIHHP
jgi:transcriptional regulator GlxA family with amidase domain